MQAFMYLLLEGTHLGILEEMVLAVDLGQLEGGTGAEALLLGQLIVLVLVVELLALGVLHHGWSVCGRTGRGGDALVQGNPANQPPKSGCKRTK